MNSLMSNSNHLHQQHHHNHARGLVTLKPSRKRKDAEGSFDAPVDALSNKAKASNPITTSAAAANRDEPAADNRLLAGYLAHEFLAQGTLFGQKWDPARAEAVPVSARNSNNNNNNNNNHLKGRSSDKKLAAEKGAASPSIGKKAPAQCYDDVARLLKSGGVHIPEVINPTQLAQWLQNQM